GRPAGAGAGEAQVAGRNSGQPGAYRRDAGNRGPAGGARRSLTARYLLDTNILSDIIRNPHGKASAAALRAGPDNVCTSIVVLSELRFGIAKKGSRRMARQLKAVLEGLEVLPFEEPGDEHYATIRADLER